VAREDTEVKDSLLGDSTPLIPKITRRTAIKVKVKFDWLEYDWLKVIQ
jgi:hypothetical protein